VSNPYALHTQIQDSVAVITIDLPNEPVNKFNRAVKDEFVALFDRLERDLNIRAAVLLSGKKDSWIAGADIDEFLELKTAADAERLSHDGQLLLDSIERMRTPLVCGIHGACLGGALEVALAAAYRIATDHPKTILALPEVQLGLIPGAGGTQRLPRLIGVRAALDIILTGKNIRAKKAYQMGLVDELVHPAILRDVAIQRARDIADGTRKHERHRSGVAGFLLDENPAGRRVVLKKAREETMKNTHGH
jgi:3-hydroxyacyl-CoA dehydrogenase/enoyl-CoA hydratase/3-hydroxybutyryl-CoA epimerase